MTVRCLWSMYIGVIANSCVMPGRGFAVLLQEACAGRVRRLSVCGLRTVLNSDDCDLHSTSGLGDGCDRGGSGGQVIVRVPWPMGKAITGPGLMGELRQHSPSSSGLLFTALSAFKWNVRQRTAPSGCRFSWQLSREPVVTSSASAFLSELSAALLISLSFSSRRRQAHLARSVFSTQRRSRPRCAAGVDEFADPGHGPLTGPSAMCLS